MVLIRILNAYARYVLYNLYIQWHRGDFVGSRPSRGINLGDISSVFVCTYNTSSCISELLGPDRGSGRPKFLFLRQIRATKQMPANTSGTPILTPLERTLSTLDDSRTLYTSLCQHVCYRDQEKQIRSHA